ncbi:LysR family transcriptional regulator [Marinomonas mediterranea]|uniref:Transcriptional regulator, LysR family n=2 Tax=Marinomonas mediterranea TaxID=119864 RepID=F2JYN8_MARM1|nr:LysR family transcriptional regulator [Marinomonas mediterranea]ADZ89663.1 transcriptional regulator, LysR family [Marinomonas mediterranea MMB-1]WCN11331.1 LysR family transcriptional regulator [Marinomonas mediterranea]WCN15393.1 LysR family transcriptional regulator [Marinomonas mediterranea]WCN19449.1 LysR family transcriptional regulator [Marinomonas mediterranea MMB-1]
MLPNPLLHMDLKSLTGLLYLLEERNVSKASDRLFISQSAMSRLLNRLRSAFNDPLFIRTATGMEPTATALRLEAPVRQMIEQLSQLAQDQEFIPANSNRTFRIKTSHYQSQAYLPFIAERFYTEAPNATLETSAFKGNIAVDETDSLIDVVLFSELFMLPNHYDVERLGHEQFGCVMSKQHPLANQESISLEDYLSYKHVLVNIGQNAKAITDFALGEHAKRRHFALKTPYFTAALEAVGKTQLLMTTSKLLAERFKDPFSLTIQKLPYEFKNTNYSIGWPKTVAQDAGSTWLRNLCRDVVLEHIPFPNI